MSDLTTAVASSATPDSSQASEATLSAADRAVAAGDVAGYKAARAAERAGTPLDPSPADSPADAASAQPGKQAASTEASSAPASEPGKTPTGHKGDAASRVQEVLADRARERTRAENAEARADRLEREIAELRRGSAPAAPATPTPTHPAAPSAAAAKAPAGQDQDPEPTLEQFENEPDPYRAWMAADARWHARQEYRQQQAAEQQRTAAKAHQDAETARLNGFKGRIDGETAKDPAWWDGISQEVKDLKPIAVAKADGEAITPYHAVAEELLDSPVAPHLMRHWSEHPEEFKKFGECATPRELFREFARQSLLFEGQPKPAAQPVKTITDAPAPPTVLGTRPAAPADETDAAVRNNDFEAYHAARLRERVANQR